MKKKIACALTLATICAGLASCGNGDGRDKVEFFKAYSHENLLGDWDYLAAKDEYGDIIEDNIPYRQRDYLMRFDCLKGENEATQLIVQANANVNEYDFVLPSLSDGVNSIDPSAFSVAAAWYQDIGGSNEDAYSGLYPDALVPLANYKYRRMNHITKGYNQSLYINFKSTTDMKPGLYKGTGKFVADGVSHDIPFEVRIYDAVMPTAVHRESCFLIWYEQIANGEFRNDNPAMHKKYFDFAVSKRLSPGRLPSSYESTYAKLADSMYELIANDERITSYRIPVTFLNYHREDIYGYLKALIDKNIALRKGGDSTTDLLKKAFFYIDDEPTASKYDSVKEHDKDVFDIKNELAEDLKDYPDLKASLLAIKNLVTTPFNESLVATNTTGGVQTWCPQFTHFNSEEGRELYASRQKSTNRSGGENVWWYGCMDPVSPYPSYHLNANLLRTRTITHMQYDYNIEGQVHWCLNYYSKYLVSNVEVSRDIWNDGITWANCAGDGCMLYPGVTFGVDGPITTLRLENVLAGNEEYEYYYLIEQKVKDYNTANGTTYDARNLLQKYFKRLFTGVISNVDNDEFNTVRLELLNVLEKFSTSLKAGMDILLEGK